MVQSKALYTYVACCKLTLLQIWEYFLASSTITSRQGGATCFQITLVKNINSSHRINGINSQFALSGALAASKVDIKANAIKSAAGTVQEKVAGALGSK
jgi:hypothetical protein